MSSQNPTEQQTAKGKKMFLLLALVFVLPFTLAFALHLLDVRPGGKSFGQLVTPVVALEVPAFGDTKGNAFAPENWQKIWSIVLVDDGNCAAACEGNVDKLNRVHRTLYKDADRIQRILILENTFDTARIQQLQEKFPKLVVLPVQDAAQQQFVETFNQAAPAGSIYIVDHHSNLMMHYPQTADPKAVRTDLKKLLKTSWGG